jgi:hypothetical protein
MVLTGKAHADIHASYEKCGMHIGDHEVLDAHGIGTGEGLYTLDNREYRGLQCSTDIEASRHTKLRTNLKGWGKGFHNPYSHPSHHTEFKAHKPKWKKPARYTAH